MAEITAPLKVLGMTLVFEVNDKDKHIFNTGTIPIHADDVEQFNEAYIVQRKCEKCNEGELIFNPSLNDSEILFTHTCSDCDNTEQFDAIYPSIGLVEDKDLSQVKTFRITITPEYSD